MHTRLRGLLILSIVAVGLVLTVLVLQHDTSGPTKTQMVVYYPWEGDDIAENLKVESTISGSCWGISSATHRAGSFRCRTGDTIYDPCFEGLIGDGFGKVACPVSPNEVVVIRLTEYIPDADINSSTGDFWMLVLDDETLCDMITGSHSSHKNGKTVNYACGKVVGLGDIDRSNDIWTLETSTDEEGEVKIRQIAKAYR